MINYSRCLGIALFLLLVLGTGCDTAPGPADLTQRPPELSDFSYSPQALILEDIPEGDIVDGKVRVQLNLTVVARDQDNNLNEVTYVVQSPLSGAEAIATGMLGSAGQGRFVADDIVEIPTAEVGNYTVIVLAADKSGLMSNQVRGMLRYVATGTPPVIDEVIVPERVQRPAEGQPPVLIPLIAVVSDPDGLGNILRVETLVNSATTIQLCDDGGEGPCGAVANSGDEVAGDGRYTVTVQLESSNAPGENVFDFFATDRSGLKSEVISRTIIIE